MDKRRALIVVDVQNDFCDGGALAVPGSNEAIPVINPLVKSRKFLYIVYTLDYHPEDHCSFEQQGGGWPRHCVIGTAGAEFNPYLYVDRDKGEIIRKGSNPKKDEYSGFGGFDENGWSLENWLDIVEVEEVYVCGLATDYCVKATALDAKKLGFNTYVIIDACRGVKERSTNMAIKKMRQAGIKIIESKEVL